MKEKREHMAAGYAEICAHHAIAYYVAILKDGDIMVGIALEPHDLIKAINGPITLEDESEQVVDRNDGTVVSKSI